MSFLFENPVLAAENKIFSYYNMPYIMGVYNNELARYGIVG